MIDKTYNPKDFEDEIYKKWENAGVFTPKIPDGISASDKSSARLTGSQANAVRKPFVISMPPPNVTGKLHIGHALFVTLQDIMSRYHRMKGEPTLWLPGTDHAGIATQNVVEKALKKEGKSRRDLGREKFVERVWKWKEEYGDQITNQIKKLGASCDWSRERFTLDEGLSKAVNEAFGQLYDKGLIYRGEYIVNWCPGCQSAISDDEVEHEEQKAKLYYFKYDKKFPITIATTRPETKLGDTAVAVNPSDERYKKYVGPKGGPLGGKEYEINLDGVKRKIKIIADRIIDKDFGTGAVGVTPAHSMVDSKLADDHGLESIKVIDGFARMTENTGKYAGQKVKEARKNLVQYLEKEGLIEKIQEVDNSLSICYRCNSAIEPLPSLQWFVKTKPLAKKAKEAIKSGKIKIVPKRFEKVYFNWLDNIRDWCISRQLWWGHRIPVYYRKPSKSKVKNQKLKVSDDKEIYVGTEPPKDAENWVQEEDVLDTWFSSALWPFSTLGWPDKNASDYKYFYPTTVMETGYDILFFWVARMIMMGLELTDKPPFETVYLHGLVRDEQNRKMSKSLGNSLDPLEVSEKYGTDAVRMGLIVGTTPGNDVSVGESKIKGYRNFSNKIWNIARFVLTNLASIKLPVSPEARAEVGKVKSEKYNFKDQDKEDLKRLDEIVKKTTKYLDNFQFSHAGELLYSYTWHEFADRIIERDKKRIYGEDEEDKVVAVLKLYRILETILKLLHPFMPFVTEAIWQNISDNVKSENDLISTPWPTSTT